MSNYRQQIYKQIEEGMPAIILEFNFYTESDFGIRLDGKCRGVCTGISYTIDELSTIKTPDKGVFITDDENNISRMCGKAIKELKNIYRELIIGYDHAEEIHQWFKSAIDWLAQNTKDVEKTFELSSLGRYNESYIKISVKNTAPFRPKDILYVIRGDKVLEGVMDRVTVTGPVIRIKTECCGEISQFFDPEDIFKTKEDAISELKNRITKAITKYSGILDEYKSKLDSLNK